MKPLARTTFGSLYVIMLCTFILKVAYNLITNEGAETLRKANWDAIEAVFLDSNQITKKKKDLKFTNPSTFVFV